MKLRQSCDSGLKKKKPFEGTSQNMVPRSKKRSVFSSLSRLLLHWNEYWEQTLRQNWKALNMQSDGPVQFESSQAVNWRECTFHLNEVRLNLTRFMLNFWQPCFQHLIHYDTSGENRKIDKATHFYKLVMDWVVLTSHWSRLTDCCRRKSHINHESNQIISRCHQCQSADV